MSEAETNVWQWATGVVSGAFLAMVSWTFRDVLKGLRDEVVKVHERLDKLERRMESLEATKKGGVR